MAIDREQTKAAIYRALEGEPEDFKATVFEIAYENKWNPNDPSFLLLAATGQLRALLRLHPAEIKQAMNEALEKAKTQWSLWHTKTLTVATGTTITAQQVTAQLADVQRLLRTERTEMVKLMAAERKELLQLMAAEREAIAQQMQQTAKQQEQLLIVQTNELIAEAVVRSRDRAAEQVKTIIAGVKRKHYVEAVAFAVTFGAALMLVSWTTAWVSRGRAEAASTWGDIERWNQDDLKACQAVNQPTCSFHIEVPED